VFTKSHYKSFTVTSFASLYLRTHTVLTFIMLVKCNLLRFRFS